MARRLVIFTDGGARGNPGPAGIGVVICGQDGTVFAEYQEYIGTATNNIAEYKALSCALNEAGKLNAEELMIYMDSELVVRQMQGRYKIKEPNLKVLAAEALRQMKSFQRVNFAHIPREKNARADKLVNEAIDAAMNGGD